MDWGFEIFVFWSWQQTNLNTLILLSFVINDVLATIDSNFRSRCCHPDAKLFGKSLEAAIASWDASGAANRDS